MPAARAARSRLIPSSASASASRRALTRPSRSRRASARSSAGVRPVVIGTATMARLPARYSRAKSWAAPTTGQDFLRPVLYWSYRRGDLAFKGGEIVVGRDLRVNLLGSRQHGRTWPERLPHYHRRGRADALSGTPPGQGIGRHRPWQTSAHD